LLTPSAEAMNPILHCDWLPEQARWCYLACSGLPAESYKKNFLKTSIDQACQSIWLDAGLALFFCEFKDVCSISDNIDVKTSWPISSHLGLTLGQ